MLERRRMWRLSRRTLWQAIPTVVGILLLNFLLLRLIPGDAVDVLAGESGGASAETLLQWRSHFGLDLSLLEQLQRYLGQLAHLDLGLSPRFNLPVSHLVLDRLPNTLVLMVGALGLALAIGIAAGTAMATWVGRWPDRVLSLAVLLLYSTPGFWIGLMAVLLFSVKLGWLPSNGFQTLGLDLHGTAWLLDRLQHAVLPVLALATFYIALYARLTRAAMLEVQRQDYVRTARAKGLTPAIIRTRHIMRNALIPVVTVVGLQIGALLAGAILTEKVFAFQGIGQALAIGFERRDYPVLQVVILMAALIYIVVNLLVDITYAIIDPRVRTR